MLVQPPTVDWEKHLRIRLALDSGGADLRFVDQRTFGGWSISPLVEVDGTMLPESVAHIARDPMDAAFDLESVVKVLRGGKHTEIKRAILDQTVVSGIGNIYADESLWRAKIHATESPKRLPGPNFENC